MKLISKLWTLIKIWSTHNYCESCGYTKDEVYVTELFTEAGYIECMSCYEKRKK